MTNDLQFQAVRYAQKLVDTYTSLGLCATDEYGRQRSVRLKNVRYTTDGAKVALEVDTDALPPGVTVEQLHTADVWRVLQPRIGRVCEYANSIGFTVVIHHRARLPDRFKLPATPRGFVYPWCFGQGETGAAWGDLQDRGQDAYTGHILIGAMTGWGKSTTLRANLANLIRLHTRESLRLWVSDPKAVEFNDFNGLPHLLRPIETQAAGAAEMMAWLVEEMQRREDQMRACNVRKLHHYNLTHANAPLPLIVVVADELGDLVDEWGGADSVPAQALKKLSRRARAAGIVLIAAMQHPRADILDTPIRTNFATRIALHCASDTHYKLVLDEKAWGRLEDVRGRALVKTPALKKPSIVQSPYLEDDEVARLIGAAKGQAAPGIRLTPVQAGLVMYAMQNPALAGRMSTTELYRQLRDDAQWRREGWSRAKLDAWIDQLKTEGWLETRTDSRGGHPRYWVTDRLSTAAARALGNG